MFWIPTCDIGSFDVFLSSRFPPYESYGMSHTVCHTVWHQTRRAIYFRFESVIPLIEILIETIRLLFIFDGGFREPHPLLLDSLSSWISSLNPRREVKLEARAILIHFYPLAFRTPPMPGNLYTNLESQFSNWFAEKLIQNSRTKGN